jgi:hypothetical protein
MDKEPKKFIRSKGVTDAERYLQKLCERSFLSLWSYAGVYRNQGKTGKEICDLLVIFDEHIIIFSDKDCEFPDTGDIELDWKRWYKKAITKSADQIYGAERWLLSHPDRVFLDKKCKYPFPFEIPTAENAKIHRIVVAHSASQRCIKELGGSGSLMLLADRPEIAHLNRPFTLKQGSSTKGFLHIFDDTTLDIVLQTLDTISDFLNYLEKKEKIFDDGTILQAAGEEELLAFYMTGVGDDRKADFAFRKSLPEISDLALLEGFWQKYLHSPQRKNRTEANTVSYLWDEIIEKLTRHAVAGTSQYNDPPGIDNQEKLLRFLARESRLRRRILSEMFLGLIKKTRKFERATRTVFPSKTGEPYYIFFVFPFLNDTPYEDYRVLRRRLLENHCLITKLKYLDAENIVGIATESGRTGLGSEDMILFDCKDWGQEMQDNAEEVKSMMIKQGLLGEYQKPRGGFVRDYPKNPDEKIPFQLDFKNNDFSRGKGRVKNSICPCGSGKKFKKCHGV